MPDSAKEDSESGAKAFVAHYVDVLNFAQTNGEVLALEKLSTDDCSACSKARDGLASTYRDGGSISGGAWSIVRIADVVPGAGGQGWAVVAVIAFGKQTVVKNPTSEPTTLPGGRVRGTFHISRASASWRMQQWFLS